MLTYNGSPAEVFYSANCGGRSESASYVWPGADLPYLKSIVDDVHRDDVAWTLERSLRDLQQVLTRNGFEGSRLSGIEVSARSESGRAVRLALHGLRPDTITGEAFRAAIGAGTLRSTATGVSGTPFWDSDSTWELTPNGGTVDVATTGAVTRFGNNIDLQAGTASATLTKTGVGEFRAVTGAFTTLNVNQGLYRIDPTAGTETAKSRA